MNIISPRFKDFFDSEINNSESDDLEIFSRKNFFINRNKGGDMSPGLFFASEEHKKYGQVPAKYFCIYWDTLLGDLFGVYNVTCAYIDKDIDNDIYWNKWTNWDTFDNCGGNSYSGFGTNGKNSLGDNFASVDWTFSHLIGEYGFTKEQEYYRFLFEFGRIKECDYARRMLYHEIGRILGLSQSGDIYIPELQTLIKDIENGLDIDFLLR